MNKWIIGLCSLLLISGSALAQQKTIEEKVAGSLAVYQQTLDLSEEQSATVEQALLEKTKIGKEAYALKKEGKEAEGKEMNQKAGKSFYQTLRATLTKEQWATYQEQKEAIKEALKESR